MCVYLKFGFIGRRESLKVREALGLKSREVGWSQTHFKDGESGVPEWLSWLSIQLLLLFFNFREGVGERGRGREREPQVVSKLSMEPNLGLDPMTLGS